MNDELEGLQQEVEDLYNVFDDGCRRLGEEQKELVGEHSRISKQIMKYANAKEKLDLLSDKVDKLAARKGLIKRIFT